MRNAGKEVETALRSDRLTDNRTKRRCSLAPTPDERRLPEYISHRCPQRNSAAADYRVFGRTARGRSRSQLAAVYSAFGDQQSQSWPCRERLGVIFRQRQGCTVYFVALENSDSLQRLCLGRQKVCIACLPVKPCVFFFWLMLRLSARRGCCVWLCATWSSETLEGFVVTTPIVSWRGGCVFCLFSWPFVVVSPSSHRHCQPCCHIAEARNAQLQQLLHACSAQQCMPWAQKTNNAGSDRRRMQTCCAFLWSTAL